MSDDALNLIPLLMRVAPQTKRPRESSAFLPSSFKKGASCISISVTYAGAALLGLAERLGDVPH